MESHGAVVTAHAIGHAHRPRCRAFREPFGGQEVSLSQGTMGQLVSLPIPFRTAADTLTDAQLVARAVDGDRWGREMLYRRHAGFLLGMTARLMGNRGEAEEIVQDTFVTGFEQLHTL